MEYLTFIEKLIQKRFKEWFLPGTRPLAAAKNKHLIYVLMYLYGTLAK
jgi:hypothetical protein